MSDVELLPCSQCGESKGYRLGEGSTYRWWVVFCSACDAEFGECGADRATNLHKDPLPDRWHWADEHWNDCNKHAHGLRQRITELEALLKARDALLLQAHQAGQHDAGVDPSYSNAQAWFAENCGHDAVAKYFEGVGK